MPNTQAAAIRPESDPASLRNLCVEYGLPTGELPIAVIGSDILIQGSVTVRTGADLVIFGEVRGPIRSEGAVVVDRGGQVFGPVHARRLCVAGSVVAAKDATGEVSDGEVHASGGLVVRSGGRITAEKISYGSLQAERGARLAGALLPSEVDMDEGLDLQRQPAAAAPTPPVAPSSGTAAQAPTATPAPVPIPQSAHPARGAEAAAFAAPSAARESSVPRAIAPTATIGSSPVGRPATVASIPMPFSLPSTAMTVEAETGAAVEAMARESSFGALDPHTRRLGGSPPPADVSRLPTLRDAMKSPSPELALPALGADDLSGASNADFEASGAPFHR